MKPICFFTVVTVALALHVAAAASAQEVETRLPDLVSLIQQEVAADEALEGVEIIGGEIAVRRLAPGRDLRVRAEGATMAQRAGVGSRVREVLNADEEWRRWLRARNDVVVLYGDDPADAAQFVLVDPTNEEAARISGLLQVVQDQIELDPDLGGALVQAAALAGREGVEGRELRVRGKVLTEDQWALLDEVFVEAMAADPWWRRMRGEIFVTVRELNPAPLSPVRASRYFALGQNAFWKGDYVTADAAFTRMIAEAPDSEIFRYWRVLTLLAMGQDLRAEQKLRPLIHRNPWGQYDGLVATGLERVQGPLRGKLQEFERRILLTLDP